MLHRQERVRGLVRALGPEPAYIGLTRTPRPLLALEPKQVEERCSALQVRGAALSPQVTS